VLWGTWFLTGAAYLSVAEGGHRYYTVMLAPTVAALVGIGVTALWRDYRRPGRRGWLLPLTLIGVAALQAYILVSYPDWGRFLTPAILGLGLGAAGLLAIARLRSRGLGEQFAYPAVAASVGVLVLLVAPTAWATYTAWQGLSGELPYAGPRASQAFGPPGAPGGPPGKGPPGGGPRKGGGPLGGGFLGGGPGGRNANPELVEYLQANKGDAGYLVAASSAMSASPIILNTDEPVVSFGGYNGIDPVFTADDLAGLVDEGAVRFFLMPDREAMEEMRAEREAAGDESPPPGGPQGGFGPGGGLPQNGSAEWIVNNCEKVPQELWQPPEDEERGRGGPPGRIRALYDCGARGS
jgi:4-amino-4-deoxy-L-arabinose transferase-like glycosyltransferase